MIPLAVRMSRSVDGVVNVTEELTFAVDDAQLPPVPDLTRHWHAVSGAGLGCRRARDRCVTHTVG